MSTYVDLHCHWIAGIDDGARTPDEGIQMLKALKSIGFGEVVATPHMRPGMFDNERADLVGAFDRMQPLLAAHADLPSVGLGSEHYFDSTVFDRILADQALPYPGQRAILLEFYPLMFPAQIQQRLVDIQRRKLLPVIAHPERYQSIWERPQLLEQLVDLGAAALLDTAALDGKYGRQPKRCARDLLERGLYHAACSDAHRPADVAPVARGMAWIAKEYGQEEVDFLFHEGPRAILAGELPT
jgi:protein-tyrosine phosphatase